MDKPSLNPESENTLDTSQDKQTASPAPLKTGGDEALAEASPDDPTADEKVLVNLRPSATKESNK